MIHILTCVILCIEYLSLKTLYFIGCNHHSRLKMFKNNIDILVLQKRVESRVKSCAIK